MSILMMLEFESPISDAEVRDALARCGVTELREDKNRYAGNFPTSNMCLSFNHCDAAVDRVKAEKMYAAWSLGAQMGFVYVISQYDECSAQLHTFLETISDVSSSNWVLSFQYESLCAIRDSDGLRWLGPF
jgi:hypothetical protein